VEALTNGNPDDMVSIEQYLSIGKWVLFGLVIAQLVSLVMALFVRCTAPTVEFHNLDAAEDRELHMQAIRDDIEERKVDTTDSRHAHPLTSLPLHIPPTQLFCPPLMCLTNLHRRSAA
jgi:hypothetical protein